MTASWAFFALSVVGALFTANAFRPRTGMFTLVPGFFAAWLTAELAPQHLVVQIVVTAGFATQGAFSDWPGLVGLGITVASWAGLVALTRESLTVADDVRDALQDGLGDDYREEIEEAAARGRLPVPVRRLAMPFRMRHPEVERVRNLRYGPYGRRNLLDVYRRRDLPAAAAAPVLVYVHGGAWIIGDKSQQGLPLVNHMASQGWVCVVPNYRLSPRSTFPDHLVDVKKALAWVREHGAEHGADPSFVVMVGGSAGGHLTAMAALTANDPEYQPGFEDADTSVQAAVPVYGVYDFANRGGHRRGRHAWGYLRMLRRMVMKVSLDDDPEAYRKASPLDRVHPAAPPFFVVHGLADTLAPCGEARDFVDTLRSVSPEPVAHLELRRTSHAFDVFVSLRTAQVVRGIERFAEWCYARRATPSRHPGTALTSARPTGS